MIDGGSAGSLRSHAIAGARGKTFPLFSRIHDVCLLHFNGFIQNIINIIDFPLSRYNACTMPELPEKPWLEKFITPIAVTVIGIVGTISVTQTQIKSSEKLADGQLEAQKEKNKSDHVLSLIKLFLGEKDKDVRKFILGYIEKLDEEVAANLASLIKDTPGEDKALRELSLKIVNKTQEKKIAEISTNLPANELNEKFLFYKDMAEAQFNQKLYLEALDNYDEALRIKDDSDVRKARNLTKEKLNEMVGNEK